MEFAPATEVEAIRARLDHPIIDADGHAIEYLPVVRDVLQAQAGDDAVAALERMTSAGALHPRAHPGPAPGRRGLAHDVVGPPDPQHPRPGDRDAAGLCSRSGWPSSASTMPSSTRPTG